MAIIKKSHKLCTACISVACLLSLCAVLAFCIANGLVPIRGKCSGTIGTIIDGDYYYSTTTGFFRFDPETSSLTRLTWYGREFCVDHYSLVYIKGKSVYSVNRITGKATLKYSSNTDISLFKVDSDTVTLLLCSAQKDSDVGFITLDRKTLNPVSEGSSNRDELYSNENYYVGGQKYMLEDSIDGLTIVCEGIPILPEGTSFYSAQSCEDSLLVTYTDMTSRELLNMLITPQGNLISIPSENYLTGCNDFLVYNDGTDLGALYILDLETLKSSQIIDTADVYSAVTDGTWLYTASPKTDGKMICWKIEFDKSNVPISLVDHFHEF